MIIFCFFNSSKNTLITFKEMLIKQTKLKLTVIFLFIFTIFILGKKIHQKNLVRNRNFNNIKYNYLNLEPINKYNLNYLINPSEKICGKNNGSGVLLISFILNRVENYEIRNAIRNTWTKKEAYKNSKFIFIIGKPVNETLFGLIKNESNLYGDLLQINYLDTYKNLVYKTILSIKWISDYCYNAKYVLKIDDDIVLNSLSLLNYLNGLPPAQNTFICLVHTNAAVIRDSNSKFYLSKEDYPADNFPDYCDGPAYIMTSDLMLNIFSLSIYNKLLYIEDVYIGTIAKILSSNYINIVDKYLNNKQESLSVVKEKQKDSYFFVYVKNIYEYYDVWNIIYSKNE